MPLAAGAFTGRACACETPREDACERERTEGEDYVKEVVSGQPERALCVTRAFGCRIQVDGDGGRLPVGLAARAARRARGRVALRAGGGG
jgi:hypothetical protein